MGDAAPYTSVEAILEELAYLSLRRHELVIENKSQIGAGGYGEVLLAKLRKPNEKDVDVAVKCVWAVGTMGDRRRFAMRFTRELKIWASIRHSNIFPLVGYYLSDNYEIAQLVSPFLANGNVAQYISRTKPQREKRMGFVCDIAAGLDFLHSHSPPICHGDLKPANVLVSDSYEAILCDFGLASLVDKSGAASGLTTSQSIKGSTRYMSPELILEIDGKHTLASDVWAWACTTFEIITDCAPYSEAKGEPQIMLAILRGEAPGRVRTLMEGAESDDRDGGLRSLAGSRTLLSSISTCWSFTPIERPMMREIVEQAFPTWDRNSSRRGESPIGSVRVRALVDSSHCSYMVGPCVRIIINGVCYATASFDAAIHEGTSTLLDVNVDVQSFREVIVLEVACLLDDTKRILGTVGIGVRDLAIRNSGTIVQLHHYALQRLEGQMNIEYKLEFTQKLAVPESIHDSNPNDFGTSRSASSGVRSFYTAESAHSDYQMFLPGGFQDFYRPLS